MESLETYYTKVENCITRLGVNLESCRGQKTGQWSLRKGSANVWVDVWHIERENKAYFQVMAPVVNIPTDNQAAFFRELLEINDRLFGVAFTLYNGWAWIKHIREVEGLDESEIMATMNRVGTYADSYDDQLAAKYGVSKSNRDEQTSSVPGPGKE